MKKAAFAAVLGLLFASPTFSQNAKPAAAPASTGTQPPVVATPATPPAAPIVVKKEKLAKADPNATIDGGKPLPAATPAATEPSKPKPVVVRPDRVNPADVHPVDLSKFETAQPGEKQPQPQATGTPFGRNRPVAGQTTVVSPPLKKPANLQPATHETAPAENH